MEKKIVNTLVKNNHKLGGNDYVRGRISGIMYMLSEKEHVFANEHIDEGYLLIAEFTPDNYDKFANIIEDQYPGLCDFMFKLES